MPSKSYPINEARAELSTLFDEALKGEPQRITRYGKEAVVMVSEKAWMKHAGGMQTLGDLLADAADEGAFTDLDLGDRPWIDRPFGADVE